MGGSRPHRTHSSPGGPGDQGGHPAGRQPALHPQVVRWESSRIPAMARNDGSPLDGPGWTIVSGGSAGPRPPPEGVRWRKEVAAVRKVPFCSPAEIEGQNFPQIA